MAGLGEARVRTAVAVAILVAIPGCPNRWVRRLVAHEAIHNPNQGPDDPAIRGPEKRPSRELSPVDEAVRAMTLAMDEGVGSIVAKLYNLEDDLKEANDRAADHPQLATELRASLEAWQTEVRATATKQPPAPAGAR